MKRTTVLALTALTGLAGLTLLVPAASAATAPARPPLRVMPLGDSITAGYGSSTQAGYRLPLWNLLAGKSSYTVDYVGSWQSPGVADPDNEGHGEARISDIRSSIDGWLNAANPDVVLLHIGINDLDHDRAPDKQAAATRASTAFTDLAERIFSDRPGVTVLVQGLIPTTGELQKTAQIFNSKMCTAVGEAGREEDPLPGAAGLVAEHRHVRPAASQRPGLPAHGHGLRQRAAEGLQRWPGAASPRDAGRFGSGVGPGPVGGLRR
ncbi:GDSL-type esterase/lipase family protein [Actinomadura harenae]|uniref:SGNH hydrolase-type esterase domain-containing protein n=1 Tax=Actinomadura harenae TaxID=2483351 RepID=A0A3M2L7Z5_9ACTN|nr:GDSL-type esterase/lipase family protein [Actinomadura harenae]RMI33771.1 hypothetical protein EBO15_41365 [Actinomadura harenae]